MKFTPLALLKSEVERAGSQKAVAAKLGVSASYVNDMLHGRRDIPAWVLECFGYVTTVTVKRKVSA